MLVTYVTDKSIEEIVKHMEGTHVDGNRIFFDLHEIYVAEEYNMDDDRQSVSNFIFSDEMKPGVIGVKSPGDIVKYINGEYRKIADDLLEEIKATLYRDGMRTSTCGDLIARILKTEEYKVYVEIGIFRGATMLEVMKECPWIHQYGIDIFTEPAKETLDKMPFLVKFIEGDFNSSPGTLIEKVPEDIDVIFYDADHSAPSTRLAIKVATDVLKPGGMLILHDTIHYPHLVRLVEEISRDDFDVITFKAEKKLYKMGHARGLTFCKKRDTTR